MPFKRGFTNRFRVEYEIINVGDLERLGLESDVTPELLVSLGAVAGRKAAVDGVRVKLLGEGEITRPLNVAVHKASAGARTKIEAAGGRVEVIS
ncbi:MAG: uL15m family ribosomal protein [Chloroflexia bacterium]